jgi:hypothetical protein
LLALVPLRITAIIRGPINEAVFVVIHTVGTVVIHEDICFIIVPGVLAAGVHEIHQTVVIIVHTVSASTWRGAIEALLVVRSEATSGIIGPIDAAIVVIVSAIGTLTLERWISLIHICRRNAARLSREIDDPIFIIVDAIATNRWFVSYTFCGVAGCNTARIEGEINQAISVVIRLISAFRQHGWIAFAEVADATATRVEGVVRQAVVIVIDAVITLRSTSIHLFVVTATRTAGFIGKVDHAVVVIVDAIATLWGFRWILFRNAASKSAAWIEREVHLTIAIIIDAVGTCRWFFGIQLIFIIGVLAASIVLIDGAVSIVITAIGAPRWQPFRLNGQFERTTDTQSSIHKNVDITWGHIG